MDALPPLSPTAVPQPLEKLEHVVADMVEVPGTPVTKKVYTAAEVARHASETDAWVVIKGEVYDVTAFQQEHPGGKKVIQKVLGKDATKQFQKYHRDGILLPYRERLVVGTLGGEERSKGWLGFLRGKS